MTTGGPVFQRERAETDVLGGKYSAEVAERQHHRPRRTTFAKLAAIMPSTLEAPPNPIGRGFTSAMRRDHPSKRRRQAIAGSCPFGVSGPARPGMLND